MPSVTNHSRYLSSHLDATRGGAPVMRTRALGGTGLRVGEIGLGTAQLGTESLPDHEAVYAISNALDMQASLVDVAPSYGRALLRLGQAMAGRRSQAQVCLKLGYGADGRQDFGPRALRHALEQALRALGTGHVDLLLLHNPGLSELQAAEPAWAELDKLKREGKALALGVSLTTVDEAKHALDKSPAQVLQLPFNVFCQDHTATLGAAAAKRVGVIVNRPLDSGWLSGRFDPLQPFFDARRRWSLAQRRRRAELQAKFEAIVAAPTGRPAQAALQFVLSQPGVSCAIPGASAWQQVIGNVSACQAVMDPGVVARLKDLWEKELKPAPLGL
jgi:aryl-alcohol dehydrogenase-like predicted oxidoreductase